MAKSSIAQLAGLLCNINIKDSEIEQILSCMTSSKSEEIAEERSQTMVYCMKEIHKKMSLEGPDLILLAKMIEERVTSVNPN